MSDSTLALTTVADIKRYLRMTPGQIAAGGGSAAAGVTSVDDALLEIFRDAVSDAFVNACGRNFGVANYTERRDGTGTYMLVLKNYPVSTITSLAIVGPRATASVESPSTPLTEDVDFVFDTRGVIRLFSMTFPRGVANIQVEYQAGFTTPPSDLLHAASKWAAVRYRELDRLGQISKAMGGETVTFDTNDMPKDVRAIVDRYSSKAAIPGDSLFTTR